MDWETVKGGALEALKKYRYVLLVLLAGIILMLLPEEKAAPPDPQQEVVVVQPSLQDSLGEILSKISGAGKCDVLLTQAAGEEVVYQMDESISETDKRFETIIISNTNREETGLVRQVNPPVYQGAIILCQGADNATVRLSIVEAVMSVTGLTSDRITVLKMK